MAEAEALVLVWRYFDEDVGQDLGKSVGLEVDASTPS